MLLIFACSTESWKCFIWFRNEKNMTMDYSIIHAIPDKHVRKDMDVYRDTTRILLETYLMLSVTYTSLESGS